MFREMLRSSPVFLPCMMHGTPCQSNRRKRELKASLIIEKKQIGMLEECVEDGADL